jgi:hypothetical protein
MREHITLLNKIQSHKGEFIPGRNEYIDWVFRYCCRFMECHDIKPIENPDILNELIIARYMETYLMVKMNYDNTDQISYIYIPDIDSIDNLLEYDIKQRGLTL